MEAKFNLKDISSKNETMINLYVFKDYIQYKYSTGLKVLPNKLQWNFKKQRYVETANNSTSEDRNLKLTNMGQTALKIIYRYENEGKELTTDCFRDEMNKVFRPNYNDAKKVLLVEHMEIWYKNLVQKKGVEKVKSRGTLINIIKKVYPRYNSLRFEDVNLIFYDKLVSYLYEKGLKPNYVGTVIRNLKTFMNETYINGLHTNVSFLKFKKISEETDHIYLEKSELELIKNASIPASYEITRDNFLIQCYTALRHSDLQTLSEFEINDGILTKKTAKTGKVISIPVHPVVEKILQKYGGFPKVEANQTMNRKIKEICEVAKLNRKVVITETIKNEKVSSTHLVWKLVSTHSGRRTALTLMYLDGIDLYSLTKISGHTTIKQLQAYLKIDSFESATNLKNHKFFS